MQTLPGKALVWVVLCGRLLCVFLTRVSNSLPAADGTLEEHLAHITSKFNKMQDQQQR